LGSQCEGWGESFLGSSLEYNASENGTVSRAVSQSVRVERFVKNLRQNAF
jgi:hypothetical protein